MRENYTLHKLHSLSGIVPVGYYLVQHLTLNTFSLAGADKFNGVIGFFEGMPTHLLLGLKALIWLPLIFHAVYGLFIAARAEPNYSAAAYKYRENRYYTLQRVSGIVAFFFLCYHMTTTSVFGKLYGVEKTIQYQNWATKLSEPVLGIPYLILLVYIVGIVASCYHFSYGIWNFCIRWGITISDQAQATMGKVAAFSFVALTGLGILALIGFFNPVLQKTEKTVEVRIEAPGMQPTGTVAR